MERKIIAAIMTIFMTISLSACGFVVKKPLSGDGSASETAETIEVGGWRATEGLFVENGASEVTTTFVKSDGDEDGYISAEVGLVIKDHEYFTFGAFANVALNVKIEIDLYDPDYLLQGITLEGTFGAGIAKENFTAVLSRYTGLGYKVLREIRLYPSYGTRSGSGALTLSGAGLKKYFEDSKMIDINVQSKPEPASSDSSQSQSASAGQQGGQSASQGGGQSSGGQPQSIDYLWQKYQDYFPIGYAIGNDRLNNYKGGLDRHYNSFTCENEMKMYTIAPNSPTDDRFWTSDNMISYVRSQGKVVRGHALIWYSGAPNWITSINNKQQLLNAITDYVTRVVNHYGNNVYCWDVVNEAIGDNNQYRSTFYSVAGIDFIKTAFRAARAANPNLKLFYNDYNMDKPAKRAKVMEMLRELISDGVPIDGVGMQGHYDTKYTSVNGVEAAIRDFSSLGLEVQITELDIKNYGNSDAAKQAELYGNLFDLFRRYSSVITGVTFWNVADDYSWLDNNQAFSYFGTGKAYPTIFDENHNKKSAFYKIFNF